jgi:hypothetical protein
VIAELTECLRREKNRIFPMIHYGFVFLSVYRWLYFSACVDRDSGVSRTMLLVVTETGAAINVFEGITMVTQPNKEQMVRSSPATRRTDPVPTMAQRLRPLCLMDGFGSVR